MSGSVRQSELFTAEDWQVLYRAFSSINFNASDPPSINRAIIGYLQTNYPEDFNDYTENSEFVALIDLLSWLAGNLAFKTDIAARENFIDTAQSRESLLRLARFLSYNPSRNQCATGIVKLVQVQTDDTLYDSNGVNLANAPIAWNNPNDQNWLERFTLVMNSAFSSTNPFGVPVKQGTVAGQPVQLYMMNAAFAQQSVGFSATINSTGMAFEVCNGDFQDQGTLLEQPPNPNAGFHLYYLNDGNGAGSPRSGFFFLFKQGSTGQQTFTIDYPVQNQLLAPTATGVNQSDVWVQTVDDAGNVLIDWTHVPALLNNNITFNTLPADQRNIFAVLSGEQDRISIRFSDGQFGNAPVGRLVVTYRTSNGLTYQINPQDIDNVTLRVSYLNASGAPRNLQLTFSLFESVGNAAAAETIEQIRQRAPLVYGTQNRMVSGEDYNVFPLQTNVAVKLKALNRIYSGQSRYIDLNDPTGTYRDLSVFADDGCLFKEPADTYQEVMTVLGVTSEELFTDVIQPALLDPQVTNAVRDVFMQAILTGASTAPAAMTWTQATISLYSTTGWFSTTHSLIQPGAMVQFSFGGGTFWAAIESVNGPINVPSPAQTAGPVVLSVPVPSTATVFAILPAFDPTISTVVTSIAAQINDRVSFSLAYDYAAGAAGGSAWVVNGPLSSLGPAVLNGTALTLMTVDYLPTMWRIATRGLRYVFESTKSVEWYDDGRRAIDRGTGDAGNDEVRVLRFNRDPNNISGGAFSRDYGLRIDSLWLYPDGTPEPRRVRVLLRDANADGYPDDPDTFYRLTSARDPSNYLFWQRLTDASAVTQCMTMVVFETMAQLNASTPAVGTTAFLVTGATPGIDDTSFWTYTGTNGWVQDFSGTYSFAIGRGPNVAASWTGASVPPAPDGDQLNFQWKHYAPSDHRLDPASSNIIDVFVLTAGYDTAIRQWIKNGADPTTLPAPPTELSLALAFASIDPYKTFSDTIVWRPVSYQLLFGAAAAPERQAKFKVVRAASTLISNGEIQGRVIVAINTFFAASRWDFGETFYFTELAAYIHQQLAGVISSVVLVPLNANAAFGDDFEITCRADQMPVSVAQVQDVVIIGANTPGALRIR